MYRLEVSPAADRDLERLKGRIQRQDWGRLQNAVKILAWQPRPPDVRKVNGSKRAYRIKVGSYRVVYEIYDNEGLVLILQIARRTEATYRT